MSERFRIDHDYHIHSKLSSCSGDHKQNAERILQYAIDNGFNEICITDHFWDSEKVPCTIQWYERQDLKHVSEILPLPQADGVKFRFGCETELDSNLTLGISHESYDKFDFIIIPTTHLHMPGFGDKTSIEDRAKIYVERLDAVLDMDLPFHKVGIAHLTCPLMAAHRKEDPMEHVKIIDAISDEELTRVFTKLAQRGAGFELNTDFARYTEPQFLEGALRPFRIGKACGCKFYLGSDAHHPEGLDDAMRRFEQIVTLLDLKESDRFYI